jgi:predicted O-methyltransferase YrrM
MSVLLHLIKWRLGLAPPEVWTTAAERACLARHAAGRRRIVEVGVWHAGTSCRLRAAMAPDGTLYAVDPFDKGRLGFSIPLVVATRQLGRIRNGRVVWVRQEGHAAARSPEIQRAAPFDFVFLDAPQLYAVMRDEWEAWAPLVGVGGVIALHDSRPLPGDPSVQPDSIRYAQACVVTDSRFRVIDEVDSTTVLVRLA